MRPAEVQFSIFSQGFANMTFELILVDLRHVRHLSGGMSIPTCNFRKSSTRTGLKKESVRGN